MNEKNIQGDRAAMVASIVLLTIMAIPVNAQDSSSVSSSTINLKQILDIVEQKNPEILAAKRNWEAKRKRTVQAATPDKIKLDIERMYAPLDQNVSGGAQEKSFLITQEIPFPTTLYLRHSFASKEAAMAGESYRAKARETRSRARTAYAMLYLTDRQLEIFKENIELMRRFAKVAESKYAAGHVIQSDALKAQVELTKMLSMEIMLFQEKQVAQAMINALMGRPANSPLGTPDDPEPRKLDAKFEDMQTLAFSERPELKKAFFAYQKASTSLSLARSEYLPDLMLGYRRRNDPMKGNSHDAILGLSLPLWFWKPAAMTQEAKAEKEMAAAELESMQVATDAELRIAWIRAKTTQRLAEIYRTSVLPQAQAALKIAEAGYQANKSNFLDLLDAQRTLLNFRLEYYRYLADYEERLAELERIVGKEL